MSTSKTKVVFQPSDIPSSFVPVLKIRAVFGESEAGRMSKFLSTGKIGGVKLSGKLVGGKGALFVDPDSVANLANPDMFKLRQRLLALRSGTPVTPEMQADANKRFTRPSKEKVRTSTPRALYVSKQSIDDVVDALPATTVSDGVKVADRMVTALERSADLQEKMLQALQEHNVMFQRFEKHWA